MSKYSNTEGYSQRDDVTCMMNLPFLSNEKLVVMVLISYHLLVMKEQDKKKIEEKKNKRC